MTSPKTIRVVAPARSLATQYGDRLEEIVASGHWPNLRLEIDPQCFLQSNHFAGSDAQRSEALIRAANDPAVDVVWFARGGYGSLRLLPELIDQLGKAARSKTYIGYSDMGFLLGALYGRKMGTLVHGPMPGDLARDGGEAAIRRTLDFISDGLQASQNNAPEAAFNLTVLSSLVAADFAPDFSGHILHLEDVGEYHYRLDRAMATLHANGMLSKLAGVRAGRFSHILVDESDASFGQSAEDIVAFWCARAGVPLLEPANIGHDADNGIVVFGS